MPGCLSRSGLYVVIILDIICVHATFRHRHTIFLFANSLVSGVENSLLLLGEAVDLFHDAGEKHTTGEADASEEIEGAFLTQSVDEEI